ncbi:MAG: ABC transporter permease [Acidobacteria bacterium]|nr:ABC transporter permease [Acidobacteriota bacterium]
MTAVVTDPAPAADVPSIDESAARPERFGAVFWVAVGWLALLTTAALLADVLPLADPADTRAGIPLSIPSGQNWLGTDALGRDLLSRVVYGARVSIIVGISAVLISSVVGGLLGMAAGYFKRATEATTLFAADVLMAFPTLLLAASIVAFTQSRGVLTVVLVIALIYLGPTIRIVRALTLGTANREFVLAARSLGATNRRILRREILPNVVPTLSSMMVVAVAGAIVAEGGLAYLNLSVAPPTPTWGAMIASAKDKLDQSLYPLLAPGGALFLTVLSLTIIGDALQKRQARNLGAI